MHEDRQQGTQAQAGIYWVVPKLNQEVHAGPLGFTKVLYYFVWAGSAEEASSLMNAYLIGEGLSLNRLQQPPRLALNQNLKSYYFPEQIIGLPEALIAPDLAPGPFKEKVLAESRKRRQKLDKGKLALRAELLLQP